jgi:hypothetical protein
MAIRLPLKTVLSNNNAGETGAGSLLGVIGIPFTIPQDTDNIVVKLTASVIGGGVSAMLQTTDDGGTTWFGVARTSIVSNANGDAAEWLSVPVNGYGTRTGGVVTSVVATGSVVSFGSVLSTIGSAAPSTVGMKSQSGLPILSQQARIALQMTAAVSNIDSCLTEVKVNSQSATA